MATLADLDFEIQNDLTNAVAAIIAKVLELEAAIAAGANPAPPLAALHLLASKLATAVAPSAPASG